MYPETRTRKTRRRLSWLTSQQSRKCYTNIYFFFSQFYFVRLSLGLVLLFFISSFGKRPDISQHLARLSTLVRMRAEENLSLPSLDRTNGCEIQSNSRYFRSTVRYNRESNRSNLSAHWFFRICLQFLFIYFFK